MEHHKHSQGPERKQHGNPAAVVPETGHSEHAAGHQGTTGAADEQNRQAEEAPHDIAGMQHGGEHAGQPMGTGSAAPLPRVNREAGHAVAHEGSHLVHTGHEAMFRRRFWACLLLTLPVLLYTPMLRMWLGLRPPTFPGSQWLAPLSSIAIFAYGGLPFLTLSRQELRQR